MLVSKAYLNTAPLKPMVGQPMRIHQKYDTILFTIHTPRTIPSTFHNQVKEELDSMVQQGITKPIGDDPSEWYHLLVVTSKDQGVCIAVNLTHLICQVSWPTQPSLKHFGAIHNVTPSARYFTPADVLCGPSTTGSTPELLPYLFTTVWHAGKHLCIPDALLRAPVSRPTPEDEIPAVNIVTHLRSIITMNNISSEKDSSLHDSDKTLQDLCTAACTDPSYTSLLEDMTSGFPSNGYELSSAVLPCWAI
ncbi:hypothetical protein SK128_006920 [Halocaridina rubra]|uniref:Uncharacterized protein n=1 Tax=Halocaridina rubra TaxID=373956 RepID=A0AAN8XMD3_HALRR